MARHNTYNRGYAAHYGDTTAILPDSFDLREDYKHPRSYTALRGDRSGYALQPRQTVRVWIDHDATGTGTSGTGDTVAISSNPARRA